MKDLSHFTDSINISTNNSIVLLVKFILVVTAFFYAATIARQHDGLPKYFAYILASIYIFSLVMYLRDRRSTSTKA